MSDIIIDVRERDEFEVEHVENSIHVPLSCFESVAPGVFHHLKNGNLILLCRSGNRANLAMQQVKQLVDTERMNLQVYGGGILEWKRKGNPTVQRRKIHLPIMRQVQLTVGLVILISILAGVCVTPWFLLIAAFFGTGLTVAGATGFCGLAMLLARMPWNKVISSGERFCHSASQSSV